MSTVNRMDPAQWCPPVPAKYLSLSTAQRSGQSPVICRRCGKRLTLRRNIYGTPLGISGHRNITFQTGDKK